MRMNGGMIEDNNEAELTLDSINRQFSPVMCGLFGTRKNARSDTKPSMMPKAVQVCLFSRSRSSKRFEDSTGPERENRKD